MQRQYIFTFQLIFLLFASAIAAGQKNAPEWKYHFPLDIAPKVSGSFGEIRSNHFHSGLDITTHGKTGLPVYAADDGYVSRIAASPFGFGKAVYIDHPSGYTTVYAHLESFSNVLDSLVLALQYQQQSFTINEYLEPGTFRVKRGEVIAYSGNSGSSGGPHLHFEVRLSEGQKPVDPLSFPTPVKDDVRPHIAGIKLYPLSRGATINGEHQSKYLPVVFYDGAFHLKHNPKIQATGTIGVGVDVIDYFSNSWRKCGIHSIDLKVNNQETYAFVMNGFFFHDTRFVNSHIDYAEKMESGRTTQKSFVDPYNHVDLYNFNEERGKIRMEPGKNFFFSYEIRDIAGNRSSLQFNIEGDRFLSETTEIDSCALVIDAGNSFFFEKNQHSVAIEPETFYEDIRGEISVRKSFISESGTVFSVLDKTIPVHKSFKVMFPLSDSISLDGLCGAVLDGNLKPQFAGGEVQGEDFVMESRICGDFLLVRDTVAPVLYLRNQPFQNNYTNRSRMLVRLEDDFSGIARYDCFIDGQWALFEYDPGQNELICDFENVPFLEKGNHQILIEATDNAGNKEILETSFSY